MGHKCACNVINIAAGVFTYPRHALRDAHACMFAYCDLPLTLTSQTNFKNILH